MPPSGGNHDCIYVGYKDIEKYRLRQELDKKNVHFLDKTNRYHAKISSDKQINWLKIAISCKNI